METKLKPDLETPEVTGIEAESAMRQAKAKKKRRNKKIIKRVVSSVIILAVIGGIVFGLIKLFAEKEEDKQIITDMVTMGNIDSTVYGTGVTKAKDSVSITLASGGTVQEVFVMEGDFVNAGDPLYTIDSSEAYEAVEKAKENLEAYQKQLDDIYASYADLSVRAPFAGKLMEVISIEPGDYISSGTTIAKIVDDSKLTVKLYFSYAYENDIKVGQAAKISIPAIMQQVDATVKEINYVKRISPEGGTLFEVVFTLNNTGALTADMEVSAFLTGSDGMEIYPYEPGTLAYNSTKEIVTKVSGEVISVNLRDYNEVSSGELLMNIDGGDNDDKISSIQEQMKIAEETYLKAQANLDNFNAVAPMSGTVLSCSLIPGEEVETGRVAISIADTSVMTVEIQIDQMNVANIKPGMGCDIVQWGRDGQLYFWGVVESVSLEGKSENGYSYFPAIIKVDNYDGTLLSNSYVEYTLIAAQSADCLLVPVQAVKYTEAGTCLFIQADSKPETALDAEEWSLDIPEGFYAVPVTVGLSNNYSAEITSGEVEFGTVVFTQYMTNPDMNNGW